MNKTKQVYIKTFGCQMNVRDSEVVCGLLKKAGYKITDNPDKAGIVLFNTCSVRQHAEDKVWSEIGRICKTKSGSVPLGRIRSSSGGDRPLIGLIGCMAQNYKDRVFQRAPSVDFVVGPSDIDKIPSIIDKLLASGKKGTVPARGRGTKPSDRFGCFPVNLGDSPLFERKIWETDGDIRSEEIYHTGFYEDKSHAYVVISEGCSNFCSYCVVPYVRGPLRNRKHKDILKEIREAADQGITQITLLGQNVNAYQFIVHGSEFRVGFIELLKKVNAIKGLKEFSFVTSHPKDTSPELFKAMAGLKKLKKCLHLPVQSGSDRILKAMNRGYTRKFYLDSVNNYRKIVKGAVLTTDIIVGFPQESENDFQDTYDLVKKVRFDAAYIFKYSPRPNTAAAKMCDDVPKEEKERRHRLILELQKAISNKIKKLNSK
ncbi:MiaB/RimO family radical SAM methylthiotransferase [bacterium]|nr:MAG: MiaB/RimO family radical SAM methylthiotransferase [bacterium]